MIDRLGGQGQQEARHAVDADLDAEQEHRTDGDQSIAGRIGQPAVQGKKRCADGQPVKQQIEGRRLVFADLWRCQQVEEIEAPALAEGVGVGMAPDEDHGTGDEEAAAEELILQEARQCQLLFAGRGPAPEQIADQRQLQRRRGGKPEQVHGRQHAHQRGLDEQQHAEQVYRGDLLARHAVEGEQHAKQGREQDEKHADAVGGGMIGEQVEPFGELHDAARDVDAPIEVERQEQFSDRKQAADGDRQASLAQEQQRHGAEQRQQLQHRQQRVAGQRRPVHFIHRITTIVAITISIR
jgi:hypothetical protein